MKSWIEVSREHLAGNYRATVDVLQRSAPPSAIDLLAVIKANAYGHGAALCAPILEAAGAPWLGVTDADEGAVVRAALQAAELPLARQPQVLVLCAHLPEDAPRMVEHSLVPVVWRHEHLDAIAQVATSIPLKLHLEVDTGMCRQGVPVGDELHSLLRRLATEPRLHLDGVLTHFASAEIAGSPQTAAQRERFEAAIGMVHAAGLRPGWVHAGNTSTIDNAAEESSLPWLAAQAARLGARAMVREGLGLYGHCLPLQGLVAGDGEQTSRLRASLQPIMTWKTRIVSLSDVPPGALIGYNGTFAARRPTRLALLPVGYADGLRRELSSTPTRPGGWVVISGERAPILGRISMNLTTVDVTVIPSAKTGDEVILLGEGITVEDHAALAHTLAYEILCGLRAPPVPI